MSIGCQTRARAMTLARELPFARWGLGSDGVDTTDNAPDLTGAQLIAIRATIGKVIEGRRLMI
jgi:hypothetical protein